MKFTKILFLYFLSLAGSSFFAGSIIMVLGTNFHNLGQLVYHFLAGRLLGKVFYGDLAALISIFGLLAIIQQAFGLTIIKFVASAKSPEEANNFTKWVWFWSIWVGVIVFVLLLFSSPFIVQFLNISQPQVIYIFIPVVLVGFISNTGRALLQGFTRFTQFVVSMVAEVGAKIVAMVLLVYLGYSLFGAVAALPVGAVVGFVIVWLGLRKNLKGPRAKMPNLSPLFAYSFPVFIQSIALTSMYSSDILLAKHFFTAEQAGLYAALAKLGTIAFFSSSPITSVMFPIIARNHTHGQPYHRIFYLSVALVTLISLAVIISYIFLSGFIIGILFGKDFVEGAPILWWFSLYMFLLGVGMLFVHFYLSIGKTKVVWLFAAAALTQIVLILVFHATLLSVIQMSIIAAALLVLGLLLYFPYHHRQR
ncbi:MAG: oligosaccharide flippase family protein [Candidatus Blackburnbacteria bacterium]|nr:oligosaccharide flippase family protein [Candidatus Blackburnbacteria bacterium]